MFTTLTLSGFFFSPTLSADPAAFHTNILYGSRCSPTLAREKRRRVEKFTTRAAGQWHRSDFLYLDGGT